MKKCTYDVTVIGGGLAGLVNAIRLSRYGHNVALFERKKYPFHRVCGEYISNEVIPFLESEGLFPKQFEPAKIEQFQLSSVNGKSIHMPLDLGGFGISRYSFDQWLAEEALASGVSLFENTSVDNVFFEQDHFQVAIRGKNEVTSRIVIGAFGKRSMLDKKMNRPFIRKKSPYIGVKYHIRTDVVPANIVGLHNFHGGYCGVSRIEDQKYNLCYLSTRDNLRKHGTIEGMEQHVVLQNPYLKNIYSNSEFILDQPEVINEISFARKEAVHDHVLMTGDAAGMITPLCGNGMAMAIHAAKISSQLVDQFLKKEITREQMERSYVAAWNSNFKVRHWAGRKIQSLFGGSFASNLAVNLGKVSQPSATFLMRQTHGVPF